MRKVKIKLKGDCTNLLQFVKNIKELCDLGWKDSKAIVDKTSIRPYRPVEIAIPSWVSVKEAHEKLNYNLGDIIEVNGGTQWQREIKMLQLEVGEREDYINFISQNILTGFCNSEDLITFALQKLNNEELIEILNKIEY